MRQKLNGKSDDLWIFHERFSLIIIANSTFCITFAVWCNQSQSASMSGQTLNIEYLSKYEASDFLVSEIALSNPLIYLKIC